jgi:hypothetical protein
VRPGALISDRFEVERRAGTGGMSIVYRARDRSTGALCAIKVLAADEARSTERFDREVRVLADLRHPAIVRYVDHGVTADGDRFLAMEWLEGEDLAERLTRAPLTIGEATRLIRLVAEALGHAHARGIVHRDIKPSNLFLPDGAIERVKVLDFGIARMLDDTGHPTRTGVRVGTPAYMSPEQARGLSTIDGRTDVFSLGCVAYECLAGRKAFAGADALAVLAKILLAEPQPLRELRPDAPPALTHLIASMMAKELDARSSDGTAIADAAAQITAELDESAGPWDATPRPVAALTVRERRLLSVVLMRHGRPVAVREVVDRAAGPAAGVRVETLKDGTVVVAVAGTDAATDLAARAARVALALRQATSGTVALATGRAVVSADIPVGEVIERASRLLRSLGEHDGTFVEVNETRDATAPPPPRSKRATARLESGVRVDEVSAGLLDARFEVSGDLAGLVLVGERAAVDATRTLLGRPTPCVGRDAELAALEAAYLASAGGEARAVLITAPAGIGKSRLRHEFLRRLAARPHEGPAPEVWLARGDPLGAAPFGMLGAALRRAAGILDGEPLELRQRKLRARVSRHVRDADVGRVAEFLGELIGAPFSDADSVQLRAARADAMLMGDQMRRAWEDLLAAECERRPLVLVLEDLQWGDPPTVSFVDSALRRLCELPFLVVGLARPEAHEVFPRLWHDRGVQVFRLSELPRRAAERLAREVLGPDADPDTVSRLVERAAGNAFYLEELLRGFVEGRGELPETVLSMVQARLEGMEAEARRILRAASVFGQVFWTGGVAALLGGQTRADQVGEWLGELAAREEVTPRREGRFPDETEYVFRHGLVREAAYAMLVDADRALGHRLAGAWLEEVGEPSATVLAEHHERGGEPQAAIVWWRRAAEQALGGNDLAAVLTACGRGVACGAAGEVLGALRLLEAEAHIWRAEFVAAEAAAAAAMRWLPRDSETWYAALDHAAFAAYSTGRREGLLAYAAELGDLGRDDAAAPGRLRTAARIVPHLTYAGATAEADALWSALTASAGPYAERDPALAAAIYGARGSLAFFDGDGSAYLEAIQEAIAACERAGDLRRAQRYRGTAGYACLELGAFERAVRQLRDALDTSTRLGLHTIAATARQNLGLALVHTGAIEQAIAEQSRAATEFMDAGNRRMEAASRYYLGYIKLRAGDLIGAEETCRDAVEMAAGPPLLPPIRAEGMAILATVLLARGNAAEALTAATEARRLLEEMGGIDGGESIIRLAHAEALHATGDAAAATAAIVEARARLEERASKIGDAALRAGFVEGVPENARTLALAAAWSPPR